MTYRKNQAIFLLLILISIGCNSWRVESPVMLTPTNEISRTWVVSSATQPYSSKSPTPQPVAATATQTPTELATATITPTWIDPMREIVKTMNPTQEWRMAQSLEIETCELPCYLGITLGETSGEEALAIMAELGARSLPDNGFYTENHWPIYLYFFYIGTDEIVFTPEAYTHGISWLVSQHVELTVGENQVERIQVSLSTPEFGETYRKYWWRRYSLEAVLRHLGEPDAVYFKPIYDWHSFYTIILIFKDLGVIVEYSGMPKDYHSDSICPLTAIEDGRPVGQSMVLTNPASPLSIFPPGRTPLVEIPEQYRPIEAVLEISVSEFARRLLADPTACFELKEVFDQ